LGPLIENTRSITTAFWPSRHIAQKALIKAVYMVRAALMEPTSEPMLSLPLLARSTPTSAMAAGTA
jgi:hypothetical protein